MDAGTEVYWSEEKSKRGSHGSWRSNSIQKEKKETLLDGPNGRRAQPKTESATRKNRAEGLLAAKKTEWKLTSEES